MSPGQKTYEAFARFDGLDKTWFALSRSEQDAWEHAARVAREDCYEPGEVIEYCCDVCDFENLITLIEK